MYLHVKRGTSLSILTVMPAFSSLAGRSRNLACLSEASLLIALWGGFYIRAWHLKVININQHGDMIEKYFAAVFFFVPFPGLNSASGQQLCI